MHLDLKWTTRGCRVADVCDPKAGARHIPWALSPGRGEDPPVCPTHGVPGFMGVFAMSDICPAGWFLLGGPNAEPEHYRARDGVRVLDQFKGRYGEGLTSEMHIHPDGEHLAIVYRNAGQDFWSPVANATAADLPPLPQAKGDDAGVPHV